MTPSQEILERASTIYFHRHGKHLLSYQSPTSNEIIDALLSWLDDNYMPREVSLPGTLLDSNEKENDSQPNYRQ